MNQAIRILLAEDDEDDIFIFEQALLEIGYPVDLKVVRDGSDVMEQLSNDIPPDLVFLDINMPKVNGIECLQIIKRSVGLPHVPIIFLSTNASGILIEEVKTTGAQGYIAKPNSIYNLILVLTSVIQLDWTLRRHSDFFLHTNP